MNVGHYTGFRVKDAIAAMTCMLIASIIVSGCKDSTKGGSRGALPATSTPQNTPVAEPFSLNSLLNSIEGATSEVQVAVGPHADAVHARTKEEVEKLFQWEYKVVDLDKGLLAGDLEVRLRELGDLGWECFSIIPSESFTRVTCKRKPKSALAYLKYLPGF